MPRKKKAASARRVAPAAEGAEIRFRISAFKPTTMPLDRLAEYLREVAIVLGEPKSVHLVGVEPGSTVPLFHVDREALPKVRERAAAIHRGDGDTKAVNAFRTINKMLRADNAVGSLRGGGGRTVLLKFPGIEMKGERYSSIRQQGSLEGEIVRVGGTDATVPILLKSEGEVLTRINANKHTAKLLAGKLFEHVRLLGSGRWNRDIDGTWTLDEFTVDNFEPMENVSIAEALNRIRGQGLEWQPEPPEDAHTSNGHTD